MSEVNHGTASAYTGSKCRCDVCKAGWSKYQSERRQRIMAELAGGGGQHGTIKAYWAGCRCDVCKAGRTERNATKVASGA